MAALVAAVVLPLVAQASAMAVDEVHFHRKRGLGLWERVGHPIDTLSVAACLGFTRVAAPSIENVAVFAGLAVLSCLLVTKDEGVHARRCSPGEHWLHAVLFVLHPICLAVFGLVWAAGAETAPSWLVPLRPLAPMLPVQLLLTLAFALYQALYWNLPWLSRSRTA